MHAFLRGQRALLERRLCLCNHAADHCMRKREVVVSPNKGPQYRPQFSIVLIIGARKKVPPILGNPQVMCHTFSLSDSKAGSCANDLTKAHEDVNGCIR